MKAFTFLFVLIACLAGCSTHFTTLQPEGSKTQLLYVVPEEQAFKIAHTAIAMTLPGRRIEPIDGLVRGYSSLFEFGLDSYTQLVLVHAAQGTDLSGREIQGYYFEVSGSGSSFLQGRLKNVGIFDKVLEYAKATGKGVEVIGIKPIAYAEVKPIESHQAQKVQHQPPHLAIDQAVKAQASGNKASFFVPSVQIDGAAKIRRTALVIGNSAYRSAPLKNPVNDARDMASTLKVLGFDVTMLTDASQQQMENAVRDFGTKLRQGGVGLFYYAGHGVQVAGENFLIPINAVVQSEGDVKYGSVNAGLVLAKMEDAGNGLNIVILDACRSNPYARSFRTAAEGLAKMDAPTGSLIAYATSPGSVASDGQGRNGVYTKHLLETMKIKGLPISEAFMRVRQGVVQETAKKQVPWEASSLIGQFYFAN